MYNYHREAFQSHAIFFLQLQKKVNILATVKANKLASWEKKIPPMMHKPVLNKHYCLFFGSNHGELTTEKLPNFEILVFSLF